MTSLALDTYEPIIGPLAEPIRVHIEAAGLSAERGGLTRAMRRTRVAQADWRRLTWMAVGRDRLSLDLDGRDVVVRSGDATAVKRVLEAASGAQPDLLPCTLGSGARSLAGLLVVGDGGAVFVAERAAPLIARTATFVPWSDSTTVAPLPGGRVRICGAGPGLELQFADEGAAGHALHRLRARLAAGFTDGNTEVTNAGVAALSMAVLWDGGKGTWRRAWLQASGDTMQLQAAGDRRSAGGSARRWAAPELRMQLPQMPGEVLRVRASDEAHGIWRPDDRLAGAQMQRLRERSFAACAKPQRCTAWRKLTGRWTDASLHPAQGACPRGAAVVARLDDALVVAWRRPDAPLPVGTAAVLVLRRGTRTVRARLQLGPEVPLDRLPASVSSRLQDPERILLRTIRPLPSTPTETPRRRRHHRVGMARPATLTTRTGGGTPHPAELRDLSLSGAAVRSATSSPPVGTQVRLTLQDDHGAELTLQARVLRTSAAPDTGAMLALEFEPLPARMEARLHRLVLGVERGEAAGTGAD